MTGVWAELMGDARVREALPELARHDLSLCLMLPSTRVGDPGLARLTRDAEDAGVPVRGWPLLSPEQGYWIGEQNVGAAAELLDAIVRWRTEPGGPALMGLSVDLEPALDFSESLRLASRGRLDKLVRLLAAHVRPADFERSRRVLAGAVDRIRRAGLWAHAVTFPSVLDQPEGSVLLEDAFDTPVSEIAWDEVSFMVYQTAFAQLTGAWLGPSLVRSYASSAVERFGERAGLDLGIVGDAGVGVDPGSRYSDPSVLRSDVRAARAAGVPAERLRVYGLAGMLDGGGITRWSVLDASLGGSSADEPRLVEGLRSGVRALEVLLRVAQRT